MKRFLLLSIICFATKLNAQIDTLVIPAPNSWSVGAVKTLMVDNADNIWFSHVGASQGLRKYDGTTWAFYQTTNSGLPSNTINAIAQDNAGLYWFGTSNGLVSFDGTNWAVYNTSNSGLSTNNITCLAVGNNNDLWIGTPNGVSLFDGSNWTHYNTTNSTLNSNLVLSLAFSGSDLYIGTNFGLSVLNTLGIQNYAALQNLSEIVVSGTEIWLRNVSGIYQFVNGAYVPITPTDVCITVDLGGPLYGRPMISGVNGGVTMAGSQGLVNYTNGTISQILVPAAARIYHKGNYYYALAMIGGVKSILKVDAVQLNPLQSPINNYYSDCARQNLDVNEVNAMVLDRADMFWDINSNPKYEVPKGSGSMATFAGSLWLGGKVNGQLRTACQTYRQNGHDFWPGSLDTVTASNQPTQALGPVIKVNRFDIENFIYNFNNGNVQSGAFTPSWGIMHWPAHDTGNFSRSKAPFVDVNQNGAYDPLTGGDYPDIKGDQMLYHVYNDASDLHLETHGTMAAMGVEIRQKSYAYTCPGIADSLKALNYTTFYEFEIINRSSNSIDSMYIGYWNDVDLGNYIDDYVGCNVTENYGYVYNGDNYDDDNQGVIGYHSDLPFFSTAIMQAPLADVNDGEDNNHNGITDEPGEQLGMSSFMYYRNNGDAVSGNPSQQQHYYNYLKGIWKNGSTMKYGGDGVTGTQTTTYHYPGVSDPIGYGLGGNPGNPVAAPAWSEITAGNMPGDRRFLMGSGPFHLAAKDTAKMVYAMVFTRVGSSNNFAAFSQNEQDVKRIKNWYATNSFPSCLDLSTVSIKTSTRNELAANMYPNPASTMITIETEDENSASIEIIDVLGKTILKKRMAAKTETLSVEQLHSGIYFVTVKSKKGQKTFKLVKE